MEPEHIRSSRGIRSLHTPKARWSPEEDEMLVDLIGKHGQTNWSILAKLMGGRTGKQCRERWITKLSPIYMSGAWTAEEDATLLRLQSAHGNQWSRFTVAFPHRPAVSIKNRWVSLRHRRRHPSMDTPPRTDGTGTEHVIDAEQPILTDSATTEMGTERELLEFGDQSDFDFFCSDD
jgi:hypothetical protein